MIKFFETKNKNSRQKVTPLYTDIQAIDMLHLSPEEYFSLSSSDRSALKYYLMVKNYHEEKQLEEIKMRNEIKSNLPKQVK